MQREPLYVVRFILKRRTMRREADRLGRRSSHKYRQPVWRSAMKMVAEYLEHALNFERMAADEPKSELKADFERLTADYRKLAAARVKKSGFEPLGGGETA